jgi:hypothetical protein
LVTIFGLQLDAFDDEPVPEGSGTQSKGNQRARLTSRVKELKVLIRAEQKKINLLYHPLFGSLFKAGLQSSRFSKQVIQFHTN